MNGLALCVLYIGISGALKGEDTLIMIISIAIGALIGEAIDIDKWLNKLGDYLESKFKSKKGKLFSWKRGNGYHRTGRDCRGRHQKCYRCNRV